MKSLSTATDSRAPKLWGGHTGPGRAGPLAQAAAWLITQRTGGLRPPPVPRPHALYTGLPSLTLGCQPFGPRAWSLLSQRHTEIRAECTSFFKAGTLAMRTAFPPQGSVSALSHQRETNRVCPESRPHQNSLAGRV